MGLFDKLKNVFFEEEYVEVEEQKPPKEKVTVAKKIETPEVRKREETIDIEAEEKEEKHEEEIKEEKDFKFPMDDKDFEMEKTLEIYEPLKSEPEKVEEPVKEEPYVEIKETREDRYEPYNNEELPTVDKIEKEEQLEEQREAPRPYEGLRNHETEEHRLYEGSKEKEEQRTFKPSPIISPIYGILNKNYTKEEIMTKKEIRLSQVTTKKADLDLVREKAYGELAGDISASIEEDTNNTKEEKEKEKEVKEEKEDLVYDLNDDESPTVKVVTVGDAEEYFNDLGLEYNVDYKVENKEEPEEEIVDIEEKEEKVHNEEKIEKEKEDDDEDKKESTDEDDKNLFDLIDSMYEDEEKDKE